MSSASLYFLAVWALWGFCYGRRGSGRLFFAPFIGLGIAIVLGDMFLAPLGDDETEHLYCAWQVSQGRVPFLDFWQHHTPTLWMLLSPLAALRATGWTLYLGARALSTTTQILSIVVGWRIARRLGGNAQLWLYATLVLAYSAQGEWSSLRPDPPMLLFSLLGVYCNIRAPERPRLWYLAAGLCMGVAIAFAPKWYLMALLAPLVIAVDLYNRRLSAKPAAEQLAFYAGGAALGLLPMFGYLVSKGIVDEFVLWVVRYNADRLRFNPGLLTLYPVLGVAGLWLHKRLLRDPNGNAGRVFLIAFTAAFLGSLTITNTALRSMWEIEGLEYYSWGFFLLCSIAACLLPVDSWLDARRRYAPVAVAVLLGVLYLPELDHLQRFLEVSGSGYSLSWSVRDNQWLLEQAAGRNTLLWFPNHPVYVENCLEKDITLHTFIIGNPVPMLKAYWRQLPNVADRIIACRPALVDLSDTVPRLQLLVRWEVLNPEDLRRVLRFFATEYKQTRMFNKLYGELKNASSPAGLEPKP